MAKLKLYDASFTGIKNTTTKEVNTSEKYEKSVEKSNIRIQKCRIRYASAFRNASTYLDG